jgi:hypothetical protein
LLHVTKNSNGDFILFDKQSWDGESIGALQTIYQDGEFYNKTTLKEIRNKLR